MKDALFEKLELPQRGFQAKRKMAADKDALFEKFEVAQPAQEPVNLLEARRIVAEYGTPDSQVDDGNLYFALSKCLEHIDAQLTQEPDALTIAYQSGYYDGKKAALAQPAQEPVARVSGVYGGRFTYDPINRAMVLPVGMALYAGPA